MGFCVHKKYAIDINTEKLVYRFGLGPWMYASREQAKYEDIDWKSLDKINVEKSNKGKRTTV